MRDAISLPSKSIGDFRREYGRDWTIGYISMWLIELNDNANVKQKMTDVQIEMTAERILDTYSLKITDLTLFFRNVKDGVYGSFYENLSREKVLEWLRVYFDDRCEYAAMQSQQKHDNFSMTKDKVNTEVINEMFKNVGQDQVDFSSAEKNGIGTRFRNKINENREVFLRTMQYEIKRTSIENLKSYLLNNDKNSSFFDSEIYEMVEKEIDSR